MILVRMGEGKAFKKPVCVRQDRNHPVHTDRANKIGFIHILIKPVGVRDAFVSFQTEAVSIAARFRARDDDGQL